MYEPVCHDVRPQSQRPHFTVYALVRNGVRPQSQRQRFTYATFFLDPKYNSLRTSTPRCSPRKPWCTFHILHILLKQQSTSLNATVYAHKTIVHILNASHSSLTQYTIVFEPVRHVHVSHTSHSTQFPLV